MQATFVDCQTYVIANKAVVDFGSGHESVSTRFTTIEV